MRGEIVNEYQKLNSEDQKTLHRWLWANAALETTAGVSRKSRVRNATVLPGVPGASGAKPGEPELKLPSDAEVDKVVARPTLGERRTVGRIGFQLDR
jgi:hypothetical protein